MRATLSVALWFNGCLNMGGSIKTFESGDRRSFLHAVDRVLPRSSGWGARLTIAAEEAQALGCELTGLDDSALLHLSLREHGEFPRLGQAVEVSLFRVPADPFAAFESAAEEAR